MAIPISLDAESAQCPHCDTRYRIVSRELVSCRQKDRRYVLVTREPSGRTRPRSLRPTKQLHFDEGSWITLVWRGSALVGIADQSSGYWFPQLQRSRISGYGRLWAFCLATAGLLSLFYLERIGAEMLSLYRGNHSLMLVWLVLLCAAAAPPAVWALRVLARGETDVLAPDDEDPFAPDGDLSDPFES
jgi:hypothetical protein